MMIKRKRNIKVLCCVLRPVSFWDNTLIVRYNLVFVILCWPPPTTSLCYSSGVMVVAAAGKEKKKKEKTMMDLSESKSWPV
jgi:hypothetical protein